MNYTRIYCGQNLEIGKVLILIQNSSKHLVNVLRKKEGSLIELFDGKGSSCTAEIISSQKKRVKVKLVEELVFQDRKGIKISLGQSLIKTEPFSFSIQKATELGVASISPLYTERTVIKLKSNSTKSRKARWQSIATHACQQCGENWLPEINEIQRLEDWAQAVKAKHKIVLYPNAETKLSSLTFDDSVAIAVGPEGDFTDSEINLLTEKDFLPVKLGERVLRADTAVISVVSAIRAMCEEF
ncbi:MAG TPA: 16S rRNA (uracil(1498)-N(3))-methyltransferase [Gammaproteobacteria bacterium]|jgi:16S rRNA (uracil1498-N3)-methyltransferase|nr:16S rRNA (uracil(1498)-N(3))-methyltransferase [Gammaproteobacteria bacterium]HIO05172.1 16S rRNA (uracil(1498)-N(3))-methyltransferase [Gammaproteobacteria bacterium]